MGVEENCKETVKLNLDNDFLICYALNIKKWGLRQMKILRLRTKGFIGLQKGLGVQETDTDLKNLSGLVAISGENGAGKSSWLELLSPYPCLFSRSPTFKNHTFLRDSYRIIDLEYEGSNYECTVKIDSDSGKSEGFIKKDGLSLTDGKISTYSQKVEEIFGSKTLFENSIFCPQNSRKISDLTTGQLKSLFSEFLRLDKLIAYETTSKQCLVVLESLRKNIESEISILGNKAENRVVFAGELSEKVKQGEVWQEEIKRLTTQISELEKDYETIKEAISKDAIKKSRLKDLEQNMTRLKEDKDRELESTENELNRLRVTLRGINDELNKYESLLKDKDKILEACRQEAEILKQIPIIEKDIDNRKGELDKYNTEINEITKTIDEQRRIIDAGKKDPEIARLETEIRFKHEKTADLEKRDPACQSSICSFIVGSIEAQKELPGLEENLSIRRGLVSETIRKAAEEMEGKSNFLVEINQKQKDNIDGLKVAKEEKLKLDNDLKTIRLLSIKKPDMAVAVSQTDNLEKRKVEITSEGIRIRDNKEKAIARIDVEEQTLSIEIDDIKKVIDNSLDEKKTSIEQQIQTTNISIKDTNKQISDINESIAVLKQTISEKISAEKELAVKKTRMDKLIQEQSEWIYLRNATSKDGLRALEIDSVVPAIMGYANELLNMSFGPTYSIKLKTQDDEGKEILAIVVIGNDGEEVMLSNLSGGEKCWLLMCIRLSMTLISKEKSGKNFLTGFSDETDGSLDVNRAIDFMHMYRAFMKIGGFETFYFISHRPECISLADHVIWFGKVNEAVKMNKDVASILSGITSESYSDKIDAIKETLGLSTNSPDGQITID